MNSNGINPPSLERALSIFELLFKERTTLTVLQISEKLGIPVASSYRIVNCLVENGYLEESKTATKGYRLGYKIALLSKACSPNNSVLNAAKPYMRNLSLETNLACQISTLSKDAVITLDQTLPKDSVTVIAQIGKEIPINLSASGAVLAAQLSEESREQFLREAWKKIQKNTKYSICDVEIFKQKLENAKKNGYAIDSEEYAIGIGCLAIPLNLRGEEDGAQIALGLTGSIDYYSSKDNIMYLFNKLKEASDGILTHVRHLSGT